VERPNFPCGHERNSTYSCISRAFTFNYNVLGGPLLLESCKEIFSPNADDMLFKIKFFCVETEKSQPQLPNRFSVFAKVWPNNWLKMTKIFLLTVLTLSITIFINWKLKQCKSYFIKKHNWVTPEYFPSFHNWY